MKTSDRIRKAVSSKKNESTVQVLTLVNKTTGEERKISFMGTKLEERSEKTICVSMIQAFISKDINLSQFYYMTLFNKMKAYKAAEKFTDLVIDTIWEMVGDKKGMKTFEEFHKQVATPVLNQKK